jgi:hypothetical protein
MRLRFTVRDLFWLTLVVAVTMAWYLQWRQTAALRHQLEITSPFRSGQNVLYDDGRVGALPQSHRSGLLEHDRGGTAAQYPRH